MNILLLLTLLVTQTALWAGYQLQGTTLSTFWGSVPPAWQRGRGVWNEFVFGRKVVIP